MSDKLSVVLDTNILVSAFGYPASVPGRVLDLARDGVMRLVMSQAILDEFARVLPRMKQLPLTTDSIREAVESLAQLSEFAEPAAVVDPNLRDATDRPILGTLIASGASFLVTEDKDLLALRAKYPIVTPVEFLSRFVA